MRMPIRSSLVPAIALASFGLLTVAPSAVHAVDEEKLDIGISLNADAFFGFNPFASASYELDDGKTKGYGTALTAYGTQWGAGTGSDWGQWTEAGLGMAFSFYDGALTVNPQLGFTFGSLLSSGAANEGIIGDGIVPNLTINLDTAKWEGQGYSGFYLPLEDNTEAGQSTNRYIHWWLNLGYKFNSIVSAGAHVEELYLDGGSRVADRVDGYFWVGPYVQVAKGSAGMRLSFGADLHDEPGNFSANDFYKLQFFYNF